MKIASGVYSDMLEVRRLTKLYNSLAAVQDVSFAVQPGQVLGCLGPNGAGKSTTVKMLIGLLQPTAGQVLFHGTDIHADLVSYRKQLGYVPEEPNLYPYLSGREYLELVATLRGMKRGERDRKIADLLQLFSMYPHREGSIASYSKGMRQRILLIAALLDNPSLLIFDEPLSGPDVVSTLIFKNLIGPAQRMREDPFLFLARTGSGGGSLFARADPAGRTASRTA